MAADYADRHLAKLEACCSFGEAACSMAVRKRSADGELKLMHRKCKTRK